MTETPNDVFDAVVKETAQRLRPVGFVRRDKVFRRVQGDVCALLQFQRSTMNTADRMLFTVNLGIVQADLLERPRSSLANSRCIDAHLGLRIGMLLPGRSDKWWEITASTNADDLADEVAGLLLEKAVPYLLRYLSTDALLELWESGRSPGLTAGQRKKLLASLRAKRRGDSS